MADALSLLTPLSWRGIRLPYDDLKTGGAHDHHDHEYDLVDGARVEMKGRKARVFSCNVIMGNTATGFLPFRYDRPWFPDVCREFIAAMTDRSAGTLVHPLEGELLCVPTTDEYTLRSGMRDGTILAVSWKETLDEVTLADAPNLDVISLVTSSAGDLDLSILALDPPLTSAATPSASFGDLVNSIVAFADTASLVTQQAAGHVTTVIAQANMVQQALERDSSSAAAAVRINAERMKSALNDLASKARSTRGNTSTYAVGKAMTLGRVAGIVGRSVDELLQLNPTLAQATLVPAGTGVRYYS